ncbi:MAG: methyltransferase type 11, partial [Chrysiogenales bacterium]
MTMREKGKTHVCPWWLGFFLASPLRKLFQNPEKILGPHVREGMTLVDVGSGMGFFSLPMARMAGPGGRVICFDVQEKMLRHLARRAAGAGLSGIIETRLSTP